MSTNLPVEMASEEPTAIFFSEECKKHYVPNWHYEKPERLDYVKRALDDLVLK